MVAVIIAYVENYKNSPRLRQFAHAAVANGAVLICADSGGAVALEWGLKPALVIGDMDSLNAQVLAQLEAEGVPVERYPAAKDETDLELAILAALARGCQQITLVGGLGGRLDQTLGNLFLLALPKLAAVGITIRGEYEEVRLLRGPGSLQLAGALGETVSLLAATANAEGLQTTNLLYPLRDETLFFGSTRGISNVMTGSPAKISIRQGLLWVIHSFGAAN